MNDASDKEVLLMKANMIRWIAAVLMLAAMALLISSPALAEVQPLPLDMKQHGFTPIKSGWSSNNMSYKDESIEIHCDAAGRKPKSSSGKITCRWVTIQIADPTQLRTTMSNESYDDHSLARAGAMAKSVEAVVACNGDFMKYTYDFGYVVRQGVFYRDALDGCRDILIVDNNGDFDYVLQATSADMAEKKAQIEADGRQIINTFSFGPVLIENGEILEPHSHMCEDTIPTQRIAIAQLGDLSYAIIEIDGGNGNGMNIKELSAYILQLFPDCKLAYNLDGGGSTHLILNGKKIHQTPNARPLSDIIYFASAQVPED